MKVLPFIYCTCIIKNTPIGSDEHTQQMGIIANTLQICTMLTQISSLIPLDTLVNYNTKWSKFTYPPMPTNQIFYTPPITNLEWWLNLKYPPQIYFYTDGSSNHPKK